MSEPYIVPRRRVNARGIILDQDGRLFCLSLVPDHHGRERSYLATPGGGVDERESLIDGLSREMIEETGVEPQIGRLLAIQQYFDGENEQLEFFFHVINAADYHNVDLSSTSHGADEIKECKFVDPKNSEILPKFLAEIDLSVLIAENQPVKIISYL